MPNSPTPAVLASEETSSLSQAIGQTKTSPFYASAEWQAAFALPAPQLRDLPRITKSQLREHSPEGFLPSGMELKDLVARGLIEEESTSGTSGASVRVVFGKTWWAEQERRALIRNPFLAGLFGERPSLRRAVLTTPGCSGVSCYNRWLNLEQRTLGDSLFVNQSRIPFTLGEEKLAGMAKEATDWAPEFLDVDPVHGAWFALLTGADFNYIHYNTSQPVTDLVAGRLDAIFDGLSSHGGNLKAGKLKLLAVAGRERRPVYPDVPTFTEAGVPEYEPLAWGGFFAPTGTPQPVLDKLSAAVARVVRLPDLVEQVRAAGNEPVGNSPGEFTAFVKSEQAKWSKVIRQLGIRLD